MRPLLIFLTIVEILLATVMLGNVFAGFNAYEMCRDGYDLEGMNGKTNLEVILGYSTYPGAKLGCWLGEKND